MIIVDKYNVLEKKSIKPIALFVDLSLVKILVQWDVNKE
jgi:hypothetical protein